MVGGGGADPSRRTFQNLGERPGVGRGCGEREPRVPQTFPRGEARPWTRPLAPRNRDARAGARTDRTAPHRTAAHAHTGGQARPPPRTRWEAWKVPAGSRSIRSQRGSSRVGGVAIGGCWRLPAGETPRRISAQSRGPCPGTGGWGGAGKGRGRVPGGGRAPLRAGLFDGGAARPP